MKAFKIEVDIISLWIKLNLQIKNQMQKFHLS